MGEPNVAPTPEELKQTEEARAEAEKAEAEAKAKAEAEEAKVGEILETKEKKEDARLVPEAVLLEYKSQNKELKKDIKELKELIQEGASKKEISQELKEIAEEHGLEVEFLEKLAKTIKSQAKAEMEADFSSKFKPLEERENAERIDKIFNEHYAKTLEALPEFKDIANKDVIKALSLNPANAKKTFAQILEDAYGHLVKGKRTLESTKPRGGAGEAEIDFGKAEKDTEYFKEIMADPELKRKYNEGLEKRLKL